MPTVSIHMPEQSGQTGLVLWLRKTSDGTLVNAGGDALTEAPASSGRFTATVTEAWAETLAAAVVNGASLTVRDGWLAEGDTIVIDGYPVAGGGGGGTDWTSTEKAQIRYQLGIDGTATAPTAPVTDPVVITPSDTGKTTLYALCVDRRGAAKSGVVVHCWLAGTRPAGSGIIADDLAETFTSGVNGVVQIPDRMLGFSYAVSVGSAENPIIVKISPTAGGTTAIPDLIS